jgi:predicted nucleic acid-binding protein
VIVVDASALIEVLLRTPAAEAIGRQLFSGRHTLHAPHLIDIEVAQVVRRYAMAGQVDTDRGRAMLVDLAVFPLWRHPHDVLLPRVWELRNNLSAYDAVYLALAEALDASLLTHDQRLATATRRHSWVQIL